MDDDLLIGAKVEWLSDRFDLKAARARHLGRPITFEFFLTDDPDNYDSVSVLGIFEGFEGNLIRVSGKVYNRNNASNIKIWRKKLI